MDERLLDKKIEKVLREQSLPDHSDSWAEETLQLMIEPLGSIGTAADLGGQQAGSDLGRRQTGSDLQDPSDGQAGSIGTAADLHNTVVNRSKITKTIMRGTLTVAASLIIGIGGLMIGAKFNPSLAENMMKWPLVGQWVEYLVGKPGLKSAIEHDRYQPINAAIKIDNTEITLNGVVADQQTLAVYYSITGDHAEEFVELSLEIPDFKAAIGIEFSGMGEEVRLSEIRAYGHEIPAQFTLAFTMDNKVFRFPVSLDASLSRESVQYELNQPLVIADYGMLDIEEINVGVINASVKARLLPAEGVKDLNIGLYLMDQNGDKIYFDSMGRLNSEAEVEAQTMEFKASISRFELDGKMFIGIDPQRTAWQSNVLSTVYFDVSSETIHSELPNQSEIIVYKGREVSALSDMSGKESEKPWITYEFLRPGMFDENPDYGGHEYGALRMEPDPSESSMGMWQTEEGAAFNIGVPETSDVDRIYLSLFVPMVDEVLKPVEIKKLN
ncbi:MAG: DUF4179 domain-containing protein [Acidaminobacter sp.]|uniref:DUF4179 domain-containing protein n=1 Tax=Acidaminobacter sp. TaxID=1872102 RepID=UPI0013839605|nr:DUF4179 domain-containing protein [Acidaminobacter sp.]MZQ98475.1 DUF4179 domain-containing protein [Acidaminobacter sp.]